MQIPIALDAFIRIPAGTRRRASFSFYKGHLGFNERKSHQIVDIDACPLLTAGLNALLPALKKLVYDLRGSGDIFALDTPWDVDMHIKMGKERPTLTQLERLAQFGNENPVARILFNGDPVLEKVRLSFPPDAFLQPSAEGEKALVNLVTENAGTAKTGVDLFCGAGTFLKPLAARGLTMIGYDSAGESVQSLGKNGIIRDLFRQPLLPDELNTFELVVIDPPRAGAKAQCVELAQSAVPRIVMVSCNPATAARDARTLIDGGYTLTRATAIDQFIYSDHVELVLVFEK